MAVGTNEVSALPRHEHAAIAPAVLVLPGHQRFVSTPCTCVALGHFPNGELRVEVPQHVPGRCVVVGSISPPAGNLERVTLVVHALRRGGARRVTALLPYLAYARQDRAPRGEGLGLEWVGELLRAVGVDEVVCVDVHGAKAAEILGLPLTSLSPAGLLADALPEAWRHDATFVAPDQGAIGRCAALARAAGGDRPIVYVRKRRTSSGVEHLGLVGVPERRAVIVDDILDTGDTLISCCRALREAGVRDIGVVLTHGLFTGERWRALLADGVEEMWITDTVLARNRPPRAKVVPVAPLLAPVLEGKPVLST